MTATKVHWSERITKFNPCSDAMKWLRTQKSAKAAWLNCERGEWMLWLLARIAPDDPTMPERRKIAGVCAEIARLVLPIFEAKYPTDKRPQQAIEFCERWAANDPAVTLEMVRNAADAAYAAADAAYAANTAYAAYAAANTAYAAANTAYAAYAAAYATAYAANTAYAAARKQHADIVRKHYPLPPKVKK